MIRRRGSAKSYDMSPLGKLLKLSCKLVVISRTTASAARSRRSELPELETPRESLSMIREIGQGEFGVVMEASATGVRGTTRVQKVAVKMLKETSGSAIQSFVKEAQRLRPLAHANVIRLLAVCFSSEPLLIVLEYMELGDLKSVLRRLQDLPDGGGLGTAHFLKLADDVACGFEYLQSIKYVHRDLAARNVLLNKAFTAKIGDFGMARRMNNSEVWCYARMHQ